jgi:hypothetical protein
MKSVTKGFILFLLILCIIPISSALNITARIGETWIVYQWEPNYTVNVYIDGIGQVTNSAFHDYYLTDIHPDEKHQIKLYNSSNTTEVMGSLTVTTLHSQLIIIILICVLIEFFIVLLFLKDPVKIILLGVVSIALSLYISTISIGYGALTILPLVTLILTGVFMVYALWTIIIEKTAW